MKIRQGFGCTPESSHENDGLLEVDSGGVLPFFTGGAQRTLEKVNKWWMARRVSPINVGVDEVMLVEGAVGNIRVGVPVGDSDDSGGD